MQTFRIALCIVIIVKLSFCIYSNCLQTFVGVAYRF